MLKLAGFVFCTALSLFAEDGRPLMQMGSEAPAGARYEVIEGTPAGHIRLDRFTGKMWRMVEEAQRPSRWVEMESIGQPLAADSLPRYQITYTNAWADSYVLIDTTSGLTWRLIYDSSNRKWLWRPVEEAGR